MKIIGVWQQPVDSFQKWKDLGINTLIQNVPENPVRYPQAQWRAEARKLGLWYIDLPSANPQDDINDPNLIAVMLPDEPAEHGITPTQLQASYAALKKSVPNKPIFVNFGGPNISENLADPKYTEYCKAADWISSDWYPRNRSQNKAPPDGRMYPLTYVERAVKNLAARAPGKPQFAAIECSWQALNPENVFFPSPDDTETIVNSVLDDCMGIYYFPMCLGHWTFDRTTPEMKARIKSINARILEPWSPPVTPVPVMTVDLGAIADGLAKVSEGIQMIVGAIKK